MSEHSPGTGMEDRTAALLETIRELTLEMHPHKAGGLRLTPASSLDLDLGFDSLSRVELLLRIEQVFGISLPEHMMAAADTPADLLRAMAGATALKTPAQGISGAAARTELEAVHEVPERADTLTEVLEWHAARHPERPHVTLYDEDNRAEVLTYGQLLERSQALAAGLIERGLQNGQTVAIMLPTCLEYFYSFMGVLLAGGVPVPIYPPARPSQIEDHLRRHARILANARTVIMVTIPEAKIPARLLKMQVLALEHIVSPQELSRAGDIPPRMNLLSHDIAHLQYTSGSTGNPKGVILTHENLLANLRGIGESLGADSTDVFVSWLPLYHDMGLIGAWLGSMYFTVPLHLMSPLTFLVRPERWLRLISDQRGTYSGGPNFAFELCLKRIRDEQLEGVDLSSWRIAFNGAEPVIPDTLRRFAERFAPFGLRPEALKPVYGLAEATVGMSFPPAGRGPRIDRVKRDALDRGGRADPAAEDEPNALEFVGCGYPLKGHEVRIVNEAGHELGDREEGRLQFKGPSATSGYFRNPEETQMLKIGGWVDSGDMAYIADGEIFLTGRRKDIIIRAGRNIYPHELEEAIGNLEGVRKGCVAVFGSLDTRSGTERLVALAETRSTDPETKAGIAHNIEALAVELLDTPLDEVMLVPPLTVPKTSSGKIRRAASREIYEGGASQVRRRAVWLQVLRLWLAGLWPQLRRWRRVTTDHLYGWYALLLGALLLVPMWFCVALMPRPVLGWKVVRLFCRPLVSGWRLPIRIQGAEHLPRGRPMVIAVNHASYLDGLILGAMLPETLHFVAKRELTGNLFSRVLLKRLGTRFVERFDMQRGVEDARQLARQGADDGPLLFFPEGTFRRHPGLLPFHLGAFQAAAELGAPVLPVVMRGTRSALRDGQWLLRRGRIHIHISPPIQAEGSGWSAAVELRNKVRAEMLRHVGEPDLAEQPVLL